MSAAGRVGCVVVAAGRGERAGFAYNKVFHKIAGRSVLSRCLDALSRPECIDEIVLVLSPGDLEAYERIKCLEGENQKVSRVVSGGETRQMSVKNGLDALSQDTEIVLIHDGARPFVNAGILESVIADARAYGSGVISTPVTDTLKETDDGEYAVRTPERARMRAVQTPQAFRYDFIMEAHRAAIADGYTATDDAALYEKRFSRVKLTRAPGAKQNIKLTTKDDFILAERLLRAPRTGTGYDVHRFIEGRALVLCGVTIPYEKGLLGHSDADVALHALMDAMLGACALGDIGKLFPDTDAAYAGISSMKLLCAARDALAQNGYAVSSADITIVCQRPKLARYIAQMRNNIAGALGLNAEFISVKATTTEGLGFEGEGLGISAQAVATIQYTGGCACEELPVFQ